MPLASSPLHSKTPIVLTVPNPVASRGRLPMNLDILDTISTYTADGEGEDEAELEDVVVHDMLVSHDIYTLLLDSSFINYRQQIQSQLVQLIMNRLVKSPNSFINIHSNCHVLRIFPTQARFCMIALFSRRRRKKIPTPLTNYSLFVHHPNKLKPNLHVSITSLVHKG